MHRLNWLQLFIARLFHIMPFDIELALRQRFHDGIELGMKQNKIYQIEPLNVWVDEVAKKHEQIQMSTYVPPAKPTIIPDARGRYFQERRKEFVTTRLMPAAPRLARILDEPPSHAMTAPEDDWTNGNADKTEHRMKAM